MFAWYVFERWEEAGGTGEHRNSAQKEPGWDRTHTHTHRHTISYFFFFFCGFILSFVSFTRIDDIQTVPPLTPSGPQGVNTAGSSLHGGVDHEMDENNGAALTGGGGGITAGEPARGSARRAL